MSITVAQSQRSHRQATPAHQALRCHADPTILPSTAGSIVQVARTTDGLTSYAGTTMTHHQLTCGEDSPRVVIRCGPRRLRVDDDDDDE